MTRRRIAHRQHIPGTPYWTGAYRHAPHLWHIFKMTRAGTPYRWTREPYRSPGTATLEAHRATDEP